MSLTTFTLFTKYVLVISLSMPMSNHLKLDRVSTYTYSGFSALKDCEKERADALKVKLDKDDKMTASECVKVK